MLFFHENEAISANLKDKIFDNENESVNENVYSTASLTITNSIRNLNKALSTYCRYRTQSCSIRLSS